MNKNKKTILLVEDEAIIAMAQADSLVKLGYEVLTAHSGEEAVEKARGASEMDLVLMDIDLGRDIDGPEAARRILAEKDVPIVFLTSHMEREYVERVREITRYGYIIKNSGDFVLQSSIETAFELFNSNRRLHTKEEEYRLLFESAPSGIFIAQDGMLKIINPASEKIIGYPEETLTTRPFTEFIHPDDLQMVVERYKRRISGEAVETDYPFRIIAADGKIALG